MEGKNYIMGSAPGSTTRINGMDIDYFSGCSYYCLHNRAELIDAAKSAMERYGIASATSCLGYGNNPVLMDVEEKAAAFFESESALYFPSGYFGNSILMEGLRDSYDIIFLDRESHYSITNAVKSSEKPFYFFDHLSAESLERELKINLKKDMRPLVICDGVFPVNGEISPVKTYNEILSKYSGSILSVDDAHATGVVGKKGKGTFEYLQLSQKDTPVQLYSTGTLSKALGGHGGIIFGDEYLIKKLRTSSAIVHASLPVPIPAAAATAVGLSILKENPDLREKLWNNVFYAKNKFKKINVLNNNSPIPIININPGKNINLQKIQEELFHSHNMAVTHIAKGKYTGVPENGALRVSIFSDHSRDQIDKLFSAIQNLIKK